MTNTTIAIFARTIKYWNTAQLIERDTENTRVIAKSVKTARIWNNAQTARTKRK